MFKRILSFFHRFLGPKGQKQAILVDMPFATPHAPVDVTPVAILDTILRDMAENYLKARKRGDAPATFSGEDIRLVLTTMREAEIQRITASRFGSLAVEEPALCEFVAHLNTAIALYQHIPQTATIH